MSASLHTETVTYQEEDLLFQGYLVYKEDPLAPAQVSPKKRPAIMIIHDALGIKPHFKDEADRLAQDMGLVALSVDMFGKGHKPKDIQAGIQLALRLKEDRLLIRRRARAWLELLFKHPLVDPRRVAALGYSFGGTTALELARSGADLAGVINFYGYLDTPTPEDARRIKAKVLVLYGAADPFLSLDQVLAFQKEMESAGVDWQWVMYGGTAHSFTIPAADDHFIRGAAYNERSARRSREAVKQFLQEVFLI